MDDEQRILEELVKAKENIKRKFIALKSGEADIQAKVIKTLEPVIEPLNRIHQHQQQAYSTLNRRQAHYNNNKPQPKDRIKAEEGEEGEEENDESIDVSKSEEDKDDATESEYNIKLEKWFRSPDFDKTYGPRKIYNFIVLGKKAIKFTNEKIIVETVEYDLTEGLLQLIFLKSPTKFTQEDVASYKNLLIDTGAHLTSNGTKVRKGNSKKYINIISKLFPSSGGGLRMKLQKTNLVYWNDPNEIVDRLRLLLASQSAGNTGVGNEILSIFEELLEAGLIKRIPNV